MVQGARHAHRHAQVAWDPLLITASLVQTQHSRSTARAMPPVLALQRLLQILEPAHVPRAGRTAWLATIARHVPPADLARCCTTVRAPPHALIISFRHPSPPAGQLHRRAFLVSLWNAPRPFHFLQ